MTIDPVILKLSDEMDPVTLMLGVGISDFMLSFLRLQDDLIRYSFFFDTARCPKLESKQTVGTVCEEVTAAIPWIMVCPTSQQS